MVVIGDAEAGKTSLINLLNLVSVPLDGDDDETLKLMTYDCGGQEQYTSGQAPNSSALYLFVINAKR